MYAIHLIFPLLESKNTKELQSRPAFLAIVQKEMIRLLPRGHSDLKSRPKDRNFCFKYIGIGKEPKRKNILIPTVYTTTYKVKQTHYVQRPLNSLVSNIEL